MGQFKIITRFLSMPIKLLNYLITNNEMKKITVRNLDLRLERSLCLRLVRAFWVRIITPAEFLSVYLKNSRISTHIGIGT